MCSCGGGASGSFRVLQKVPLWSSVDLEFRVLRYRFKVLGFAS